MKPAMDLVTRIRQAPPLARDVAMLAIGFAVLRAWASLARPPLAYGDTGSYMHFDLLGNGGDRLWTVPLLFNAMPNDQARTLAQLVIGIVCWTALAFAIAASLSQPTVARLGAVLVLLLGLCVQVTEWDEILLSESLALSLTALVVACLLWVRLNPRRWPQIVLLGALTLWVFNRQLQAGLFIFAAVLGIAWIVLSKRHLLWFAACLATLATWGGYATVNSSKPITRENAHDILVLRVLQNTANASFFAARGMPDVPLLLRQAKAKKDEGAQDPVVQDPVWQAWVDRHWQRTYASWVIHHPHQDIDLLATDMPSDLSGYANYGSIRSALPAPVQDFLWERTLPAGDVALLLGVALSLWLVSLSRRRTGTLDAIAGFLLVSAVVWSLAAWHLGAVDLQRILTPSAALLRISLLLLALASLDRIIGARIAQHSTMRAPSVHDRDRVPEHA